MKLKLLLCLMAFHLSYIYPAQPEVKVQEAVDKKEKSTFVRDLVISLTSTAFGVLLIFAIRKMIEAKEQPIIYQQPVASIDQQNLTMPPAPAITTSATAPSTMTGVPMARFRVYDYYPVAPNTTPRRTHSHEAIPYLYKGQQQNNGLQFTGNSQILSSASAGSNQDATYDRTRNNAFLDKLQNSQIDS